MTPNSVDTNVDKSQLLESAVSKIVDGFSRKDLQSLLANRGLSHLQGDSILKKDLTEGLMKELKPFVWKSFPQGLSSSSVQTCDGSMLKAGNTVLVFGGLDQERNEQMILWRWDIEKRIGFQKVELWPHPRTMIAGNYCAIHDHKLWVFPAPRNRNLQTAVIVHLDTVSPVTSLDSQHQLRMTCTECAVTGEPPALHNLRRNMDCVVLHGRAFVVGAPSMDIVYTFDFEQAHWTRQYTTTSAPLSTWNFMRATAYDDSVYVIASQLSTTRVHMFRLDLDTWHWTVVSTAGTPPSHRVHPSAAIISDERDNHHWVLHGGRLPGKFNVQSNTYAFCFKTSVWRELVTRGQPLAREWHSAVGVGRAMIVAGGRIDISTREPPKMPFHVDDLAQSVEVLLCTGDKKEDVAAAGHVASITNIQRMRKERVLTDMSLNVDGVIIPAHRVVLAAQSPVFSRMLTLGMSESQQCAVYIQDADSSSVQRMLDYMYGELSMNITQLQCVELYKLADKYDIEGLKLECVSHLKTQTDVSNIAEILPIASATGHTDLLDHCRHVAVTDVVQFVQSDAFKHVLLDDVDMATCFLGSVLEEQRAGCTSFGGSFEKFAPCALGEEQRAELSGRGEHVAGVVRGVNGSSPSLAGSGEISRRFSERFNERYSVHGGPIRLWGARAQSEAGSSSEYHVHMDSDSEGDVRQGTTRSWLRSESISNALSPLRDTETYVTSYVGQGQLSVHSERSRYSSEQSGSYREHHEQLGAQSSLGNELHVLDTALLQLRDSIEVQLQESVRRGDVGVVRAASETLRSRQEAGQLAPLTPEQVRRRRAEGD